MSKRSFLRNIALVGLAAPLNLMNLKSALARVRHRDPVEVAGDEDFWSAVRGDYDLKPDYINLENSYYCFMPRQTMERQIEHLRTVNYEGSYYMRTVQQENKKKLSGSMLRR